MGVERRRSRRRRYRSGARASTRVCVRRATEHGILRDRRKWPAPRVRSRGRDSPTGAPGIALRRVAAVVQALRAELTDSGPPVARARRRRGLVHDGPT